MNSIYQTNVYYEGDTVDLDHQLGKIGRYGYSYGEKWTSKSCQIHILLYSLNLAHYVT